VTKHHAYWIKKINMKLLLTFIMMSSLYCFAETNKIMNVTLPDFTTANHKELESITSRLLKERKEQAQYLISQFNNEKTSIDAKGYIIYLLGKLRYNDTIPFLVENIDFCLVCTVMLEQDSLCLNLYCIA